ncbi:hypothetical protein [Pseudomonas triticifolii]|uniref:Uncharacterized protein n=1 Tax=Pseudomonas triticifolii TaxID=2762592 RepID=A0ABR7BC15_9PSED|nr:hypothetical protein [Pseudomonas triticifolii]MBC3954737.1 hypothetical protein [Pseudomonas triticifolii]
MSSPSSPTIPVPFVAEAKPGKTGTEDIYEVILKGPITLELPAFDDESCTLVLLNLANADGTNRPLASGNSPFTSGQPTRVTITNDHTEESMNFKPGQKAKITGVLVGSSAKLPASRIYSFV